MFNILREDGALLRVDKNKLIAKRQLCFYYIYGFVQFDGAYKVSIPAFYNEYGDISYITVRKQGPSFGSWLQEGVSYIIPYPDKRNGFSENSWCDLETNIPYSLYIPRVKHKDIKSNIYIINYDDLLT